ncbi:MAG TPA: DNA methyltransferase [Candidatus Binataceae bacterium]|nr:DNA methyltransferase [Candidatus Binataceae bacterium]
MNTLYYGDNLAVLRESIKDETVDLVYLDPPFNSQATYNVLFKAPGGEQSHAQIEAFEDTWHWGESAEHAFDEVMGSGNTAASELLRALRDFLKENDMMAYLAMMAIRLLELHRALKATGSLYLHCDPTASHYLKLLLDSIFSPLNFRNEIVWRRTGSNNSADRFGPIHQIILFYGKTDAAKFKYPKGPYTNDYIKKFFRQSDEHGKYRTVLLTGPGTRTGDSGTPWRGYDPTTSGRHWQPASFLYDKYRKLTGNDLATYPLIQRLDKLDEIGLIHWGVKATVPTYKLHLAEAEGVPLQDIWAFQPGTEGCVYQRPNDGIDQDVKWLSAKDRERLGYPTQKPLGLLERIIRASTDEGDTVLDPFCGCGTAIHAAEKLKRKWIGIDVTHLAISLIETRLADAFPGIKYDVHGTPKDFEGARDLATRDKYQFQWWAVSLVKAIPFGNKKKGADTGIDGLIYFKDFRDGKAVTEKIIVSVKGGENVSVSMLRDLGHVVDREKAKMGLFVTLAKPTDPMLKEALKAGYFETTVGGEYLKSGKYRKLQIITIEDLLAGRKPDLPPLISSFAQAPQEPPRQATLV